MSSKLTQRIISSIGNDKTAQAIKMTDDHLVTSERQFLAQGVSFSSVYYRDGRCVIERDDPEFRAKVWLDEMMKVTSPSPALADLIRQASGYVNFHPRDIVNLEPIQMYLDCVDLKRFHAEEQEMVGEFLKYFRLMCSSIRAYLRTLMGHDLLNFFRSLAEAATDCDDLEYFKFLLERYRYFSDDVCFGNFLDHVLYHYDGGAGEGSGIGQYIIDHFHPSTPATLFHHIMVAIQMRYYDDFVIMMGQAQRIRCFSGWRDVFSVKSLDSGDSRFVAFFA